ncbi:hypothetical protein [Neolewinella antarctica]|uniref:Uncharacterized protein n=1 Tax=Neolewinella antarctica TaxID=442734 RepID=A0ABX0XB43_9BACT|nr:hypothetical protein [Neolewinella antarctica]NJC25997.1 hypothetical protein [Neolewinella antarctica]
MRHPTVFDIPVLHPDRWLKSAFAVVNKFFVIVPRALLPQPFIGQTIDAFAVKAIYHKTFTGGQANDWLRRPAQKERFQPSECPKVDTDRLIGLGGLRLGFLRKPQRNFGH